MSQNKFMHPRNIYRKPPSFRELAIQYPEFRKIAKQDLSGKISIDFKDQEALRALTCSLLHKDFGLRVDIPLSRLVPTLPLRLNYLLWLEDLLEAAGCRKEAYSSVKGIDIGTGASCIYSLLAAKTNGWYMIATEVDEESISVARHNVENNNLQELITVKSVESETLLKNVAETGQKYTFSMCNPPFFSSEQELDYIAKSRSALRTPPHNATTGDVKELIAPGGEVAFVSRMMEESKELLDAVRIYTSMIGHKSNLGELKQKLNLLEVTSMAETRFCQGNTTRWGLAWTFEKNLNLNTSVQIASKKKSSTPMSYIVPETFGTKAVPYSLDGITTRVLELLEELKIKYKKRKENKYMKVFELTAYTNTWSHQRQKKRKLQGQMTSERSAANDEHEKQKKRKDLDDREGDNAEKRLKGNSDDIIDSEYSKPSSAQVDSLERMSSEILQISQIEEAVLTMDTESGAKSLSSEGNVILLASEIQRDSDVTVCSSNEKASGGMSQIAVLEASLIIRIVESPVCLEMLWQGGTGGRDAMHQVMQFLKNRLK